MKADIESLETKAIHAGEKPRLLGSVIPPIFQTSMFEFAGTDEDMAYIRYNNLPNHEILGRKLAELECGEAGLVTASGMSAVSATLLTILAHGGHLLVHRNIYGGTYGFIVDDLPAYGMSYDFIDTTNPERWQEKLRPETRAIYTETITSPMMEVPDHPAVTAFAQEHGLLSVVDNTFASPVNYRPIEHGYDLVIHSATKYLHGHSDVAAGVVVGAREIVKKIHGTLVHLGAHLDPHACFLLHRGIKTLPIRVRYHNQSALDLARSLEVHPRVNHVNYPGLNRHPGRLLAEKIMEGFGGMLSFELQGGPEERKKFLTGLNLPIHAVSLGGVETLIIEPALTSHVNLSPEARQRAGISDNLMRVSVGLENTDDLIADFQRALSF